MRFKAHLLPWGRPDASAWCASRAVSSRVPGSKKPRKHLLRDAVSERASAGVGVAGSKYDPYSVLCACWCRMCRVCGQAKVLFVALERAFLVDRAARAWECAAWFSGGGVFIFVYVYKYG